MKKVLIELSISEELNNKVEETVSKYGLSIEEAIRMFLENVADNEKLPFEVEATRKYSRKELIARLEEAVGDKPLEVVDY